jgi:hypothetical protein
LIEEQAGNEVRSTVGLSKLRTTNSPNEQVERAYDPSWQPLLPSSLGNARVPIEEATIGPLDALQADQAVILQIGNETNWILYYIFAAIAEVLSGVAGMETRNIAANANERGCRA